MHYDIKAKKMIFEVRMLLWNITKISVPIIFLGLVLLPSWRSYADTSNLEVYGVWEKEAQSFPPPFEFSIIVIFEVMPSSVTQKANCLISGKQFSASVTSKARISKEIIEILESKDDGVEINEYTYCRTSIKAGLNRYRIEGNKLIFQLKSGKEDIFRRVK